MEKGDGGITQKKGVNKILETKVFYYFLLAMFVVNIFWTRNDTDKYVFPSC